MINTTYAMLMLGQLLPLNHSLYRFSDYTPTDNQVKSLVKVVPTDLEQRALFAEYVIQLMSCSHLWADHISKNDPTNTYQIAVDTETLSLVDNPLERLHSLLEGSYTTDIDPNLDQILNKLFSILTV